ncbi:MAG: glycosyltransferase family 4 protein [Roseiflexaceae bacterium]
MIAPFGIRPKGTLLVRMLPLAQALAQRGHRVTIAAPPVQNPQDAGQTVLYGGVSVTHTARLARPEPLAVAQQTVALLRAALADQPDVLHLFKPKGYGGLAALLAQRLRPDLPLVVDTDDWEGWGGWNDLLPYPRAAKTLFAWQERNLPRRAHAVTVASRTLQTQVWGFGVPPQRVVYLPNGIAGDTPALARRPAGGAPTMLLYTRFWEFRVADLVATLVPVAQRRPDARLRVIGRGERGEEQELLRLAQRAGIAGMLEMCGWVEPAQIPQLVAACDVALVPVDDTLINRARCSAKLLELMAAGLPVAGSRVGQMGEYLEDERSGLLAAPGDQAGLARVLLRLLDDAELRVRLGAAARARATSVFAWERLAQQAERAYELARGLRLEA